MKKIEINGEEYELKYSLKRVEIIESVTHLPTLAELNNSGGALSISALKTYFAYGLKRLGSEVFEPPKRGMEMCEQLIETEGYMNVCGFVLEALEEDCPFFFRQA